MGGDGTIPRDINAFLDRYEKDNHLKSNYLLNVDNDDSVIRANYIADRKIYEIKILHRSVEDTRLDIVIVDDITQVKDDERRQKDLAANVSHELKTPLTVIRASEFFVSNITPTNMPSYEELIKWGNRIIANAVRMQDIVQDFLILSMCSQSVPMTITDVGEAINRAVNNLTDYPGRDKVEIKVPEKMYFPLVYGNLNLIMRVIINLLTNGVKYIDYDGKTEPNTIEISVVEIGDRIGIEVKDNGRGIPAKDIDHLFERFFRVDNSGSRDVGGSGIGLSIAKDVADMHDGTISVSSNMGQGSAFTLVLPQAAGVFESIYDDAATGVISDNPYYRSAAEFMTLQAAEAVRSLGYDDAAEAVDDEEAPVAACHASAHFVGSVQSPILPAKPSENALVADASQVLPQILPSVPPSVKACLRIPMPPLASFTPLLNVTSTPSHSSTVSWYSQVRMYWIAASASAMPWRASKPRRG